MCFFFDYLLVGKYRIKFTRILTAFVDLNMLGRRMGESSHGSQERAVSSIYFTLSVLEWYEVYFPSSTLT